jgi:hypothetical protein
MYDGEEERQAAIPASLDTKIVEEVIAENKVLLN